MAIGRSRNHWPSQPAFDAASVTPSDSTNLPVAASAFYIGTTGDVKITTLAGTAIVFTAVPAGIFPVGATRVWSTGTTASNIIALFN